MPRIIDAHTHIFPHALAEKASASIGSFYDIPMHYSASVEKLLAAEKEINASHILVCSSAVTPKQVESINDFIADECQKHPEFIGLGAMHPEYADYETELDRILSLGLHGVKFHPDFQKFPIDEPRFFPVFRAIAKRGLPVLFHTGDRRYHYSSPEQLTTLMRAVPDLIAVGAHFGGYSEWDAAYAQPKNPQVFYDTSSALFELDRERALRMIEKFGTEQFMFGTDFPMWSPKEELQRFYDLGLSESENQALLFDNCAKLYKLKSE